MRTVGTAALTLEPQAQQHAAEMFVVLSDPAIYEYENEPPASLEALRRRYAALEARRSPDGREQWLNWVIRLPTGEPIGYVQATVYPDRRAAIAYELGSAWWGRGLARQAVEAMVAELVARQLLPAPETLPPAAHRRSSYTLAAQRPAAARGGSSHAGASTSRPG